VFSTKYEWLEDELCPTSAEMDATGVAAAGSTQFTLATTADSRFFRVGHILSCDSELMRVTASDYTGTITISRSFGGTDAAAHATELTMEIVGVAMIEGTDASTGYKLDVATGYNYTPPKRSWVPRLVIAG